MKGSVVGWVTKCVGGCTKGCVGGMCDKKVVFRRWVRQVADDQTFCDAVNTTTSNDFATVSKK